jgi:hypothetical protein
MGGEGAGERLCTGRFGRVEVALDVAEQRLDQADASLTRAAETSE